MIREDFLQQNAFHDDDTFCPLEKQITMIKAIFSFYAFAERELKRLDLTALRSSKATEFVAQLKYQANTSFEGKGGEEILAELQKLLLAFAGGSQ